MGAVVTSAGAQAVAPRDWPAQSGALRSAPGRPPIDFDISIIRELARAAVALGAFAAWGLVLLLLVAD